VDNDVIVSPGWLEALVACAGETGATVVSPLICQGTPLHDHAGQWCVECVYAGRIRVRSFELTERDGDRCRFEFRSEVFAGVGEAGTLIPPFEYHILENAGESKAVTVHVYHGELTWCHAFFPEDEAEGVYRRERKALGYSD